VAGVFRAEVAEIIFRWQGLIAGPVWLISEAPRRRFPDVPHLVFLKLDFSSAAKFL
jgi:hypothetical protein